MSASAASINQSLSTLVDITDAILRGEFDKNTFDIDAEGVLQELASKINAMIVNLRTVEEPLSSAGEQAPNIVDKAHTVVGLMKKTAGEVLDKSDRLSDLIEGLEAKINSTDNLSEAARAEMAADIETIKNDIFDIIATQTSQDVARQKMEVMIGEINQMRDWLIESLVILNIRKDASPENVKKKAEILRDVIEPTTEAKEKQDLVDDLLAEFGF